MSDEVEMEPGEPPARQSPRSACQTRARPPGSPGQPAAAPSRTPLLPVDGNSLAQRGKKMQKVIGAGGEASKDEVMSHHVCRFAAQNAAPTLTLD